MEDQRLDNLLLELLAVPLRRSLPPCGRLYVTYTNRRATPVHRCVRRQCAVLTDFVLCFPSQVHGRRP